MTLADKLLSENSNLFPDFPSPSSFASNLKSFADTNFSNFKSLEVFKGLTFYSGTPPTDPITTEEYVATLDGIYYNDNNSNNKFDSKIDNKLADCRVFISHDGVYLLKKYNEIKDTIGDSEIALFLEYSKGDIFSDPVTIMVAGKKVKKHAEDFLKVKWITDRYTISKQKQEKLLENIISSKSIEDVLFSALIDVQNFAVNTIADLGISVLGKIESFFTETLRTPDSFWNSDEPNYTLGIAGDLIEGLIKNTSKEVDTLIEKYGTLLPEGIKEALLSVQKIVDYFLNVVFKVIRTVAEFFIALICGIWNALMDTIGGVFGLISLLIQGIKAANNITTGTINYAKNAEYYNNLALEYMDAMLVEAFKINWKEVLDNALKEMVEITKIIADIPELLIKKTMSVNHTEAGYYVGYIIFEIVSFLFPPIKLAEIGKLGKLAKFDKVKKIANILPDVPKSKGVNLVDDFLQFIEPFIIELKKGTASIKKFINDVLLGLRIWLQDLFTGIFKTSDEVTELFRRGKSKTAKGEVRFRRAELDVFARRLEKNYSHLKLKVNIVTPNSNANKIRLKRWDAENVLGSFSAGPPPVIYVRQRCTRLTMQHEIWHLEDYNRLGATDYKKISNWKHEESVWLKIIQNKDQWAQTELIDSYKYYKRSTFAGGGSPIINDELEKLL